MVERQSAPFKKWEISVVPLAMEPSITARWEIDLSPGICTSPFNAPIALISLTLIYYIPEFLQQFSRFFLGGLFIELNPQNPFFKFSVMDDADILDIDAA